MGHQTPQAHGVDPDAGRACAAPGALQDGALRGVVAPVSLASARRAAVSRAVPDGASTLLSWCSSMISTLSIHGAASAARRIMSTAPMAKFGATTALHRPWPNSWSSSARSSGVRPVVPTTACTPLAAHQRRFSRARDAWVKSTATSAPAAPNASADPAMVRPSTSAPAQGGSTAATSSRSAASATAVHTVAPIRPPAPNTPTLITGRTSFDDVPFGEREAAEGVRIRLRVVALPGQRRHLGPAPAGVETAQQLVGVGRRHCGPPPR